MLSLHISNIYAKKKGIAKKLILTLRAIMISQEVHFVAGDFNGIAWQRFHTEEHDHTCRVGCPNEPDSLTHYNECPRLYNIFVSFWRHATILPQRNRSLHDLITRVFIQSRQYGIVVLGFLDAFVYAHKHRQDSENPGNFSDCMKGRIRCLRPRISGNVSCSTHTLVSRTQTLSQTLLPKPRPDIRIFPMLVPLHVKEAMIIVGGLFYSGGGTRVVDGKNYCWMECDFTIILMEELMSRLVLSCHHRGSSRFLWVARTHSNNTAEMIAMIEALSFLGLHGPVARDENMLLFLAWARSRLLHMCNWHSRVKDP